ncbi:hypothetical protein BKA57DRAFT_498811 [Linnemannia elongata]|nr:hypothetical protein BKA57DRAFT_498811 [Linnemannia elongata]
MPVQHHHALPGFLAAFCPPGSMLHSHVLSPYEFTGVAGALRLGVAELAAGSSFLVAVKTEAGVIAALQDIAATSLSVIGTHEESLQK